ncbi:DNA translocase FtsK [Streptococcus pneumoniae]|nr:DNA translocase FtsK [Streptococcus pneumoniae]
MKQRGKRIRPSGKDLVFHFTIASLSCEDNPADQLAGF